MRLWVQAYNRRDLGEIMHLYSPDAVMELAPGGTSFGVNEIRSRLAKTFATLGMSLLIRNEIYMGQWAAIEWQDPVGLEGCTIFRIEEGLIRLHRSYWDSAKLIAAYGPDRAN
ncbi:nuclear transport factor 2 family protein [Roseomonas sp. BN140053]|uniref:nuclear transport factor 2 family protein n=1 Tax=Roseomonas sp. BN140053 TaxID=3391898 RepID=UPI0039EABF18